MVKGQALARHWPGGGQALTMVQIVVSKSDIVTICNKLYNYYFGICIKKAYKGLRSNGITGTYGENGEKRQYGSEVISGSESRQK